MNDQQTFVDNVKRWVVLDKQLKFVNEKTRQIRESKTELSKSICQYVETKHLLSRTIGLSDGELKFIEKREYAPLSFSYIEECLDDLITDKEQVDFIIQYLKDHRDVRVSTEIRRVVNNDTHKLPPSVDHK